MQPNQSVQDGKTHNRTDGYRWYIQAYHHTGLAMDPMLCAWFATKDEAEEELALRQERRANGW